MSQRKRSQQQPRANVVSASKYGRKSPAMSNRHRCYRCCCWCSYCCSAARTRPPCTSCRQPRRQNNRHTFIPASTSTTSGVGAGDGAGEDELPPAAESSLLATNSFWEVARLLGISIYRAYHRQIFARVLLDRGVWCVS